MEATGGFEPPNRGFADLRLSPLGYVALIVSTAELVPRAGFEPTQANAHGPLKTACLPIPPPRPSGASHIISSTTLRGTHHSWSGPPSLSAIIGNSEGTNWILFAFQISIWKTIATASESGMPPVLELPLSYRPNTELKHYMAFSGRQREKQVRLTVFDNEPMARLAEQRLQAVGIPCVTRSLRGGPGLWGSAYNLPHDLYVYESDEMRARELLDLAPQELAERESQTARSGSNQNLWLVLTGAILVALLLVIVVVLSNNSG